MPGSILSPLLVGRAHELEILHDALRATQNGAGRCLLLAGEAGIGKSRLAAELCDRAAAEQFLVLQGHCSEQDRSYPYAPWIDALRAFLAPRNPEAVKELLGPFAPELAKLLPELSLLLPSIQPSSPLDPAAEKHRLFESLTRFAASLATGQPLLIVLEDLHWSDEQSLEFLHYLVRRSAGVPALVLGTYRSEDSSPRLAYHLLGLYRDHLAEEILLSPLTRSEAGQMVQAILRTQRPISPGLLDMLMLLTEGNPFFVEEMIKSLPKADTLSGEWNQVSIPRIPRSIQQTVQRRVEELPERTRQTLALASVIGERIDFALLREIAAEDEQTLLHILHELIAAQLIIEQSADQFAFRHALTREVVYATLMLRERRAMHQEIGETLERFAGGQARTQVDARAAPPASLAYHFYEAGEWQKAMEYAQRAGEKAQALYATREALVHFTRVLDAARQLDIPIPLSALRGRAQALDVLGEFDRARADYETTLQLARRGAGRADRVGEWRALIDLGSLWQSRDLERAGEHYQSALEVARNLGDASILAQTLNRIGNWHFNRGRVREGLQFHREALELFRKSNDRRGMAQTMDLLALVSYQLGEVIQGAAYLEQAVPIFRELDDRQGLVNALTNLTVRAITDAEVLGEIDYMQLTNLSDEALQIARGISWYQGEALALIPGAFALQRAGEYGRALERLAQAQPLVEQGQNRELLARLHLTLGQILTSLLALSEARQHFETALTMLQELGSGLLTVSAKMHLASVAVLQNDVAEARALLAELLPADPAEYPNGQELIPQRRCWIAIAELKLMERYPAHALEIVDRLLASTPNLAQYGPHAVPRLSRLRAQALAALGRTEEAQAELQGALPVALWQGQRPMLWRLHADLGNLYRTMSRRGDAEDEFSSARAIIQDLGNNVPEGALRDNFLRQALAIIPAAPSLTPRQSAKKRFDGLTARERQVAALIAQGKTSREIAEHLVVTERTAEVHVSNILSKLGFSSRAQIAAWAVENGLTGNSSDTRN